MLKLALTLIQLISAIPKLEALFDVLVKAYLFQRYKIDQTLFAEAEQKARQTKDTSELQKQIGKFLLFTGIIILVQGCATGAPVKSLCYLDFVNKVCWVNKAHGEGFTFEEMVKQQEMCESEGGKNIPCWYGIDGVDLQRIHNRLSQGR